MALKRSRTRLIAALAVVALGSVAFGWTSQAPATGIDTSVTITYDLALKSFKGVVTAAPPCGGVRDIVITLLRHRKPKRVIIGDTKSSTDGSWSFTRKHAHGKFFAKALIENEPATGYAGYASTVVCEEGSSPTIKVERRHHRRHRR